MELRNNVIIINGVDKTYQVETIRLEGYRFAVKFLNSDRVYLYSNENVLWLTNPTSVCVADCHVFVNGKRLIDVKEVNIFSSLASCYYAITCGNDFTRHYAASEVVISHSCLKGGACSVFDYLKQCAGINRLGANEDEESSEGILSSIYSKISFIDESSVASIYLNPTRAIKQNSAGTPLFPFGCNASQERAVKIALTNQISVIQGPPGTGKTQTILNIIANLLKAKKTMLIVSNNNSATENVLEKLEKNGLGFLVALLGNRENKEAFIANQPPLNPAIRSWSKTAIELRRASSAVKASLEKVEDVFAMQERLAICRQELAEVQIEMAHYKQEHNIKFSNKGVKTSSAKILKTASQLKNYNIAYDINSRGLFKRLKSMFGKLSLELRLRLLLEIKDEVTAESIPGIISLLDWLFYLRRVQELESEIANIETRLSQLDAKALMAALTDNSMAVLKASLAKRHKDRRNIIASVKDLYDNSKRVLKDYPIVLSTTFSAKTCFNDDTIFDYVIMDEASQVSVDTGLLALTCAKNAVIVGDRMQLPNVVSEDKRILLDEIRKSTGIADCYDAASQSFLSSVLEAIPGIPETLLREHYRCHPDIISFCNQKFYGGNLLIMTERTDDEKHLLALTTAPDSIAEDITTNAKLMP